MDHRICFYSDDSHKSCGHRRSDFVVAGVAVEYDRTNVRNALLEAEQGSRKGHADWFRTSHEKRERYIEAVLGIESLRRRIFFCPFDALLDSEYWGAIQTTLDAAICVYSTGRCHHLIAHEGLQGKTRFLLRRALMKRGHSRIGMDSGQLAKDPEIRLADAIAGYVRCELYRGDSQRAVLTNIPDFFENLEPKIRNPPG